MASVISATPPDYSNLALPHCWKGGLVGTLLKLLKCLKGLPTMEVIFLGLREVGKRSNLQNAFINTRVIEYWNKLPHHVKDSTSVEMFKSRLESHKKACISDPNTRSSNFWELSDILLNKIDDSNRNAHIDFLKRNPEIAKHKKTNIFYVK